MKPTDQSTRSLSTTSDDDLLTNARDGDSAAYGELWRRHADAGKAIARRFTATDQADDLVAEAFTRILSTMKRGGGPISGFRPYLITTIRNTARRWAEKPQAIAVDDFDQFEDPATLDDPAIAALDRTLTLTAFRSLPERWQTVLWYSEVEAMDPHEIAPFLGMTANAVAALSYRARAGLRTAWLQAHLNDDSSSPECRTTTSRLSNYIAKKLNERDRQAVADHLATCTKCTIVAGELDNVGSRLAFVLVPLLLGTGVGAGFLAALGHGTAAAGAAAATAAGAGASGAALAAAPQPTVVAAASASSSTAAGSAAGASSFAGWIIAGAVTLGLVAAGSAVAVVAVSNSHASPTSVVSAPTKSSGSQADAAPAVVPSPSPSDLPVDSTVTPPVTQSPNDKSDAGSPSSPVVVGAVAPLAPVVTTVIDNSALAPFTISGTGEPGATITIFDDRSALLATVTADASGNWSSGALAGLTPVVTGLSVIQTDTAGNHSPKATVGPIALVPTIDSPSENAQFTAGSDLPITVHGWPGSELQLTLDGTVIFPAGGEHAIFDGSGNLSLSMTVGNKGGHTLGFRYVAGARTATAQKVIDFTVTG